jgi:hypothetical protein
MLLFLETAALSPFYVTLKVIVHRIRDPEGDQVRRGGK